MITKEKIQEISNKNYFTDFVLSIIKNKDIPEKFLNELEITFPEISDEILSSSKVENCSCDRKIQAHIILHQDKWSDFLYNFNEANNIDNIIIENIEKYDNLEENIQNQDKNYKVNLSGKIAKTTIDEWKDFTVKINESCTFNNFSVIKENDEILVFFI